MKKTYKQTRIACYMGYITQAIVNNFVPLLFIHFIVHYQLTLKWITLITTLNFLIQLITDLVCVKYIDKFGYRKSVLIAHMLCVLGFVLLVILPECMPSIIGILISVGFYAIGGGLIEVLISPILEECPTENKEAQMSLLHSFYCWGHLGVILISTCFFMCFGIERWKVLTLLWCLIPLINSVNFMMCPIEVAKIEKVKSVNFLLKDKFFWIFVVLMILAGSSEQAMSQWASAFASSSLHLSKEMGDVFGIGMFALCMGASRALYGHYGDKMALSKAMMLSACFCFLSYVIVSLIPHPYVALMGCALCGFSVGIFWPGTLSMVSKMNYGGTALYALLALAGDLGCSGGPSVVGFVASAFSDDLKVGMRLASLFPLAIFIIMMRVKKHENTN